MSQTESFDHTAKRPDRPRSRPDRGNTSPKPSLGEVYLDTFDPPALASTSELYMEVYAAVRAILDRYSWRLAIVAPKAAWDAAAQSVTEALHSSGGQRR